MIGAPADVAAACTAGGELRRGVRAVRERERDRGAVDAQLERVVRAVDHGRARERGVADLGRRARRLRDRDRVRCRARARRRTRASRTRAPARRPRRRSRCRRRRGGRARDDVRRADAARGREPVDGEREVAAERAGAGGDARPRSGSTTCAASACHDGRRRERVRGGLQRRRVGCGSARSSRSDALRGGDLVLDRVLEAARSAATSAAMIALVSRPVARPPIDWVTTPPRAGRARSRSAPSSSRRSGRRRAADPDVTTAPPSGARPSRQRRITRRSREGWGSCLPHPSDCSSSPAASD